jgi:carbon storage regulator
MLILSRRIGETIMIGNNIEVSILEVRNGQVRVGVQAPAEVPVHREEVFERIQQEQRKAQRVAPRSQLSL